MTKRHQGHNFLVVDPPADTPVWSAKFRIIPVPTYAERTPAIPRKREIILLPNSNREHRLMFEFKQPIYQIIDALSVSHFTDAEPFDLVKQTNLWTAIAMFREDLVKMLRVQPAVLRRSSRQRLRCQYGPAVFYAASRRGDSGYVFAAGWIPSSLDERVAQSIEAAAREALNLPSGDTPEGD